MKYNLLNTILFLTVVLVSCNSVDDVLKPSDSISISILETLDTVRVVPGDTVSFKFMVFTTGEPSRTLIWRLTTRYSRNIPKR